MCVLVVSSSVLLLPDPITSYSCIVSLPIPLYSNNLWFADNVPWPDFLQGILSFFRLALMDVFAITAVDCYAPFDFWTPFWGVTILTLSILIGAAILHRVTPWFVQRCFPDKISWAQNIRSGLLKGTTIYMTIFYPAISSKSLSLWNCTAVGGQYFLTSDFSVLCQGPYYNRASIFNIVFVLGVVLGWPLFLGMT